MKTHLPETYLTSPHQKAAEIISKFRNLSPDIDLAKRSSLNMAEYMITLVQELSDIPPMTRRYWEEVKGEICRITS